MPNSRLHEIIARHEKDILSEWMRLQFDALGGRRDRVTEPQLRAISQEFISVLVAGLTGGTGTDIHTPQWQGTRDFLTDLSRQRVAQGFSPSETATFVFSFKQPLFLRLREEFGNDTDSLAAEIWRATDLLDKLGLFTTEVFQKSREQVISLQQQEMLELSTPVVELWNGVLALPLIGTLDSARTQIVMQNLLEAIVANSATIAIIDITGVPTVDTLVAQHLLKTVAAARLMGAECIISGIRPQIAQTIIHLGVDLSGVITKATLADAFHLSLQKKRLLIGKAEK